MKKVRRRARGYVRVSTLKRSQRDSPKHQESSIREEAKKLGDEIDHIYMDRATGTSIMEREDVQQIIKDAKNGEFDTLFFSSLSRFSRDTLDALALKRTLVNALGIRVVSIEDFYDSGKEDNEMIFTVISSMNQKQSENISMGSKRGIRQSARSGNFIGSIAPYGYRKVKVNGRKTLEIVEHDANIVRLIFDMYAHQKFGEKNITLYLNEEAKIQSPKGGMWGISSIQRILRNRNYTGYNNFGKMKYEQVYDDLNNLHNRRKKLVEKPREQWEISEEPTHPAIIPVELFEAAEDIRLRRGGGKRGGGRILVNIFAGTIFCKQCGYAMVTVGKVKKRVRTDDTVHYHYLICSGRRRMGSSACSNNQWIAYYNFRDKLVEGLIKRLKKMIDSEALANIVTKTAAFKQNNSEKERKKIEKALTTNRKLLFEIRKRHMLQEILDDQYDFEREIYEHEIAELEKRKTKLIQLIAARKNTKKLMEDVKEALAGFSQLDTYDDVTKARIILFQLVIKITVDKDGNTDVYTILK